MGVGTFRHFLASVSRRQWEGCQGMVPLERVEIAGTAMHVLTT